MKLSRARVLGALFVFIACLCAGSAFWNLWNEGGKRKASQAELTKNLLAQALAESGRTNKLPSEMTLNLVGKPTPVVVQYSFDPELQARMENLMDTYRPDYGAFVAIDATTGRVLSMVSHSEVERDHHENYALKASFPSASVFKVVTAAAAIAQRKVSGDTLITFTGANHTLYRSNVFKPDRGRWVRQMSLKEAFAKSVNTVFGRIGVFTVGASELRAYADRFGFNRKISADFPIEEGRALITDDPWEIAEAASGYTRDNTMSPLQGALIAATVVNGGKMMEPYIVDSLHSPDGTQIYAASPRLANIAIDEATAREVRVLMNETVRRGTSKHAFRGFFKREFMDLDVGGKTGSLTGTQPPGRYDWFVGYADSGNHKIAFAAMTVHQKLWRVKSSYLTRLAIEEYFSKRRLHSRREGIQASARTAVN